MRTIGCDLHSRKQTVAMLDTTAGEVVSLATNPGFRGCFWVLTSTKAIESSSIWRKRVGVEPTIRPAKDRIAGFEDREGHRTPFASGISIGVRREGFQLRRLACE